jgi:Flp pilus assembly protein TadG
VKRARSQRSQALVEFALVSPVLLLLTFGIIDFGRAMYFYVTIAEAAREVGRVAVHTSGDVNTSTATAWVPLPTNADLTSAVETHTPGLVIGTPACMNGPISGTPPVNQAYLYVTAPTGAAPGSANAPGGESAAAAAGSCSATVPATGQVQLAVTIQYNYAPVTPLVSSVIGNHLLLTTVATVRTEY